MTRGGKKEGSAAAVDPITEVRTRLKKLAFSRHILSQNPAKFVPSKTLAPSKTVMKHHGKDILRKSQRKNRYLFSFPGLLGPISGGKIGELKDLGTKNPVLYLDFPQVCSNCCLDLSRVPPSVFFFASLAELEQELLTGICVCLLFMVLQIFYLIFCLED